MQRRSMLLATAAMATAAVPTSSIAKAKTPLKIIVGFPAGGSTDTLARLLAEGLRDDHAPVTVENIPGAGGRVALNHVKRAAPDGQTVILQTSAPMVLFPHMHKNLDYDPVNDFTPVSLLTHFQMGLVAGPGSEARTVADLIAAAKKAPGKLTYGTPGQGTLSHFTGVLFEQQTGVQLNHMPFQGSSQAQAALLARKMDFKFDLVSDNAKLHRTGKVRILAVTGPKRDPDLPNVPTMKEAGVDLVATAWFGLYGPAGMSPDVRDSLYQTVSTALEKHAIHDRLHTLGYEPVGGTPDELADTQKADLARWAAPIKASGIALD
jgi:tripartite-type tricarboxylate transporter receptor subunit TctC